MKNAETCSPLCAEKEYSTIFKSWKFVRINGSLKRYNGGPIFAPNVQIFCSSIYRPSCFQNRISNNTG